MHLAALHGLGAGGTAVLPAPEASPGLTAAENTLWKLRELQSKIHKSSTDTVQHYTGKKSIFPPN